MTSVFLLMGTSPEGAPQSPLVVFFPYLLILFIFYFLLIRPQQKRATEHRKFVDQLKNGDKVITDSGLYGSVVGVDEDSVILKIDDNVKVRLLKGKVAGLQPTGELKKKAAPANMAIVDSGGTTTPRPMASGLSGNLFLDTMRTTSKTSPTTAAISIEATIERVSRVPSSPGAKIEVTRSETPFH